MILFLWARRCFLVDDIRHITYFFTRSGDARHAGLVGHFSRDDAAQSSRFTVLICRRGPSPARGHAPRHAIIVCKYNTNNNTIPQHTRVFIYHLPSPSYKVEVMQNSTEQQQQHDRHTGHTIHHQYHFSEVIKIERSARIRHGWPSSSPFYLLKAVSCPRSYAP